MMVCAELFGSKSMSTETLAPWALPAIINEAENNAAAK
jgi:hypothetical protein